MKVEHFLPLLSALLLLVEVHPQTIPYVSFMGGALANHSYVNLSMVGISAVDGVQCHTDLGTCCSGAQGFHRGDWYFPNGTRLPFTGDIYETRLGQRVDVRRSATSPSGVYRCDIPTNTVFSDTDLSARETVYVGLFASGGKLTIWLLGMLYRMDIFFSCLYE